MHIGPIEREKQSVIHAGASLEIPEGSGDEGEFLGFFIPIGCECELCGRHPEGGYRAVPPGMWESNEVRSSVKLGPETLRRWPADLPAAAGSVPSAA